MNIFVIITGILELALSLLLSVSIMYLTFKFLHFINKKIDDLTELKSNNYSVALYNASILFSVAWIAKTSVNGAITSLTMLLRNPSITIYSILQTIGVISLQIIISVLIAFFTVYIGLIIFTKLTKHINEFELIKSNNISIAIIISTIVVIVALFVEPSVKTIIQGLIPYPSVFGNPV